MGQYLLPPGLIRVGTDDADGSGLLQVAHEEFARGDADGLSGFNGRSLISWLRILAVVQVDFTLTKGSQPVTFSTDG
ncbi:hypothetical protein C7271_00970 [filamentous cyanobacterium CCP5]|nr:hypothetical protein C7271_00970 [filamentous cyanobacterium CCP5]